jgi:adenine-specific DNA-methyltransferase
LAKELRQHSTDAENILWRHLRNRHLLGWKFLRQRPIGPYVVDFYCAEAGLVIEADGGQHLDRAGSDRKRKASPESHGLKVLRFWNDEVLKQTDAVLERIVDALGAVPSPQPSPQRGEGE